MIYRFTVFTKSLFAVALLCPITAIAQQTDASSLIVRAMTRSQPKLAPGQSATQLGDGRWLLLGGDQERSQATIVDASTGKAVAMSVRLGQPRSHHTATLLPDGSVLVLGGTDGVGNVVAAAEQYTRESGSFTSFDSLGLIPRTGHTATVLADGRLLITGGMDGRKRALYEAELYNSATKSVERFNAKTDIARLNHVAALLPSNTVLLWGGTTGDTQALVNGEVYDPASQRFTAVSHDAAERLVAILNAQTPPAILTTEPAEDARHVDLNRVIAVRFAKPMSVNTLNEEGVTLIGPQGAVAIKPVALERGLLLFVTPRQEMLPASHYTLFINGARDEFGQVMPLAAVSFTTMALEQKANISRTPGGVHSPAVGVQAATDLAGVSGNAATKSGASQSASFAAKQTQKQAQTLAEIQSRVASAASNMDDELWLPGPQQRKGQWLSGRDTLARLTMPRRESLSKALHGDMDMQKLSWKDIHQQTKQQNVLQKASSNVLQAAGDLTAVAGQVLRLNGKPLANVTVSIDRLSTRTDDHGEFVLSGVPAGPQLVVVEGFSANRADATYGRFDFKTTVLPGQTNDLPFVIWMPKLDMQHAVNIASQTTTATVITNPLIPGLELVLPAGTVIRDAYGKIVTQVSITPIPVDQTPFPMPYFGIPPYFTLQPGSAVLQNISGKPQGAILRYPNYTSHGPGYGVQLYDYDPKGRGWYIYGNGQVSADSNTVVASKDLVIYHFHATGAFFGGTPSDGPQSPPCAAGTCCAPGGAGPGEGSCSDPNSPSKPSGPGGGNCGSGGDPVNLYTGKFELTERDMMVADVAPIDLLRTYHSSDTFNGTNIVRPFGYGSTSPYEIYLYLPGGSYSSIHLVLPNASVVRFPTLGSGNSASETFSNRDSGGAYYQSYIKMDGNGNFVLYFRDGRKWAFSHSGARLIWTEDRNGNRTTLTRSGTYVSRITSPSGRYIDFAYNAVGLVDSATDQTGRKVRYGYDGNRLSTITDPNNAVRTYIWDTTANRLTQIKDANNSIVLTNVYDAGSGRVIKQTLADSSTFFYSYTLNKSGNVSKTEVTDRRGNVRRVEFDGNGNVIKNTYPVGKPEEQVTTYQVDSSTGRTLSSTDALNRSTLYGYDGLGNMDSVTRLYGTPNAVTSTITYTDFSLPSSATDPNGLTTVNTYYPSGDLKTVTDPLGHAVTLVWDSQGKLQSVEDPLRHVIQLDYAGPDLAGISDAINNRAGYFTDASGRTIVSTDPLGNRTLTDYDILGRVKQITDPLNNLIQYSYDNVSNMLTHTDQNGNVTTYTYNVMNLPASKQVPMGQLSTNLYDAAGMLRQVTDRKSLVKQIYYDGLGRIIKIGYGATVAQPAVFASTVDVTWDKGNRPTRIVDSASGTVIRTYDDLDRLTLETTPQGSVKYTYDAGGRRRTMTVTSQSVTQPTVRYTYDDADRMVQLAQDAGPANGNVAQTIKFEYDNANRRIKTTLANGITAAYSYDDANRLSTIAYQKSDGTSIGDLAYAYDAAGRRIQSSGSLAQTDLPASVDDAAYNANNELTRWAGRTFAYDTNGNLIDDGSRAYVWDERNRLKSLSGAATASFNYDVIGRRTGKTVAGTATGFLFDGNNFVQELDTISGTGNIKANLLTAGIDELLARMTGSGANAKVSTILTDGNNNVLQLTDSAQETTDSYTYEAYGLTTQTGTSDNSQQYTGREKDQTGLYYYRNRYYMPECNRFISADPIGWASGQTNDYAYVGGDPILFVDPLGLDRWGDTSANIRYTPKAGEPVNETTSLALTCFSICVGAGNPGPGVTITSGKEGGHSKGSAHEKGEACDVGKNSNPDLTRPKTEECYNQCFPANSSWGQEEGNHYHMQTRPGRNGGTGFIPGVH